MNREQLKAILLLRWQLTRNQWAKSGGLGAIIAALVAIAGLILAIGGFFGGFAIGALALEDAASQSVAWVWLGITAAFLFFWTIGLITELQRSETIDLQRLMHLPVSLGQIFTFNYLASLLAPSVIIIVPLITGLSLGLVRSHGPAMLLLLPLGFGMIFMVSAWTYCLRGWLATMMSNPRKRRTIVMALTMFLILLFQGPNLYMNVFLRKSGKSPANAISKESAQHFLTVARFIPPLWPAVCSKALAENNPLPAVLGICGLAGLGALGLRRSYTSTLKFYHGETSDRAPAENVHPTPADSPHLPPDGRPTFMELTIPRVPEESSAIAVAVFRSMMRAPEVKMMLGMSFVITVFIGGSFFSNRGMKIPAGAHLFIIPAMLTFLVLNLIQLAGNQFGFDRDGFRSLVLSPVDRSHILLGKNLGILPILLIPGTFWITLISIWFKLSAWTVAAGIFQLATMAFILGTSGNLLSILVPYRIQAGTMKPTKIPAAKMLLMAFCQILLPLAMLPLFVPALIEYSMESWQIPAIPANFLLSAALAAGMAIVYWQSLNPLGRLLQRRESRILETVTSEVE